MKKVKVEAPKATKSSARIGHFYSFKGHPMVRIEGSFMGGGFNMSKAKVLAILENHKELRAFVEGKLDEEIAGLADDEILKL